MPTTSSFFANPATTENPLTFVLEITVGVMFFIIVYLVAFICIYYHYFHKRNSAPAGEEVKNGLVSTMRKDSGQMKRSSMGSKVGKRQSLVTKKRQSIRKMSSSHLRTAKSAPSKKKMSSTSNG